MLPWWTNAPFLAASVVTKVRSHSMKTTMRSIFLWMRGKVICCLHGRSSFVGMAGNPLPTLLFASSILRTVWYEKASVGLLSVNWTQCPLCWLMRWRPCHNLSNTPQQHHHANHRQSVPIKRMKSMHSFLRTLLVTFLSLTLLMHHQCFSAPKVKILQSLQSNLCWWLSSDFRINQSWPKSSCQICCKDSLQHVF